MEKAYWDLKEPCGTSLHQQVRDCGIDVDAWDPVRRERAGVTYNFKPMKLPKSAKSE